MALDIPLPAFMEQRRIAAILGQADALRAKQNQVVQNLQSLAQSMFLEMFDDPSTWPERWRMGVIGDMAISVQYGTSAKAGDEGELPILRMGNITDGGRLDLSDLKFISLPRNEIERFSVRRGDLLFNRTNSTEKVGKASVVDTDEHFVFAGYLVRVRFTSAAEAEFVSTYLASPHGRAVRKRMAKSAVNQANINATEMRGIPIAIPPESDQREFVRRLRLARRVADSAAPAALHSLFASLQSRAFRGEL